MKRFRVIAALTVACCALPGAGRAVPGLLPLTANFTWSPSNPALAQTVTFYATASASGARVTYAGLCFTGTSSFCLTPFADSPTTVESAAACAFGSNWSHEWTHKFVARGVYYATLTVRASGCPGVNAEQTAVPSSPPGLKVTVS